MSAYTITLTTIQTQKYRYLFQRNSEKLKKITEVTYYIDCTNSISGDMDNDIYFQIQLK